MRRGLNAFRIDGLQFLERLQYAVQLGGHGLKLILFEPKARKTGHMRRVLYCNFHTQTRKLRVETGSNCLYS
jgi:hypothetical protein